MRIGIFVYRISIGKSGGVQQYAERIIYALGKYSDNKIVVFCSPKNIKIFEKYKRNNVSIVLLGRRHKYIRILINNRYIWKSPFLLKLARKIFSNEYFQRLMDLLGDYKSTIEKMVDVVHFPYQVLDRYDLDIPTLITLHDLQHEYFPEFFSKEEIKQKTMHYKKSAEVCSRIIVSFEHVKKDIIKFYNISSKKIDICAIGYELKSEIKTEKFPKIQKKYNIPNEYLIYSAKTWKHKNHIRLIYAVKLLHDKYNKKIHLVCTGSRNDFYSKIKSEIKKLDLEKYVIFTGFIPEEEFNVILKKAKLAVIPTLYEAGSFPLSEAMAFGVPVICANTTALPEQIKDKRFIFNPYSIEEIASKVYEMLTNKKMRKENIENSERQTLESKREKRIINFINSYQKALS